jgi:hypothetical protein
MWNDEIALRAAVAQRADDHLGAAARRRLLGRRRRRQVAPRLAVLRRFATWFAERPARPPKAAEGPGARGALCGT